MSNNNLPNIGTVATIKIDGLSIRYARAGGSKGIPILLTAPYPESFYAFHRLVKAISFSVRGMVVYLLKYLIRDSYIAEKASTNIIFFVAPG